MPSTTRRRPDPAGVLDAMAAYLGKSESVVSSDDPFRVLIATVISQRTRDEQTEAASRALFAKYPTLDALADAQIRGIESAIRMSGFYHEKAKKVRAIARKIRDDFNGQTPDSMDELLALPGVGRKTANCVLVFAFGVPAIPVDIHVHRIANRLGWVETDDPEDTETALMALVPRARWLELNHLFVQFGRNVCLPRNPRCAQCPVNALCAKRI